jgi:hypothetical protein
MRRIFLLMLGLPGILTSLCAQEFRLAFADKTFSIPADSIDRLYRIDLGKGNRLKIELRDLADLDRFDNVDSLLLIFMGDCKPLRDSLTDPLSAKRIDYHCDAEGRKKIRIRQTFPEGSSFLIDHDGLAALKLEQDTIVITMASPLIRLTFYLNRWNELDSYVGTGLNDKLRLLRKSRRALWTLPDKDHHEVHLSSDQSITADKTGGYLHRTNDYLTTVMTVNIQNYQNYFTPSFSLGLQIHVGNNIFHPNSSSFRQPDHDLSFTWEPMFFFAPVTPGHLQVYRNDFLVLGYRLQKKDEHRQPGPPHIAFNPGISLGWLVYRQGDYFEKNSFRLGISGAQIWNGAATLQPCIYFHDFLRTVTPGLRLLVNF